MNTNTNNNTVQSHDLEWWMLNNSLTLTEEMKMEVILFIQKKMLILLSYSSL